VLPHASGLAFRSRRSLHARVAHRLPRCTFQALFVPSFSWRANSPRGPRLRYTRGNSWTAASAAREQHQALLSFSAVRATPAALHVPVAMYGLERC
jgi:hypothetical protein